MKKKELKKVTVPDLIGLIPDEYIEKIGQELEVDKWTKKITAQLLFKLLLFGLFSSERISLRVMEENFKDPHFQALVPALEIGKIRWTGIRDRLINVNADFFHQIYEFLYKEIETKFGDQEILGFNLKRYDSTMIATFAHLLEGMKVGNTSKGKTQAKITTQFTNSFLIRMDFFHDQAHLSEETALKEAIENSASEKQDIHVFDKGLKSRKTFKKFSESETRFVTRLNSEPRYELVEQLVSDKSQDTEELEFIQDAIVQLYTSGHKKLDTHFRLIQYRVKKDGTILSFLTNVMDIEAFLVAKIYRMRWDIEVLFRFMKQEMNLSHFVCNDKNAIQVMLYCTMIASMMILIFKKENGFKSYKIAKIRFFKELQSSILLDYLDRIDDIEELKIRLKELVHQRK